MVGLIIGIIMLVTGVIASIKFNNYEQYEYSFGKERTAERPLKQFSWIPLVAGVLLFIVLTSLGCFTTIPTGHTGVVTTFGRVENYTLDAGVNAKAPWHSVVKMDNREQKSSSTLTCFSSDIQEVNVVYTLNYRINKSNAQELYKSVGKNYYDTVIVPTISETVPPAAAELSSTNTIRRAPTF